jgi:hypothetical protein
VDDLENVTRRSREQLRERTAELHILVTKLEAIIADLSRQRDTGTPMAASREQALEAVLADLADASAALAEEARQLDHILRDIDAS